MRLLFAVLSLIIYCGGFSQSVSGQRAELKKQEVFPNINFSESAAVSDFFVDDYGSIYLFKNKNISLVKYSAKGVEIGRMLFPLPLKLQDTGNPMSLFFFSESAQEVRFADHHLNLIQKIELRGKFGFIKMAYALDAEKIWLLDDSSKRLILYNFREDRVLSSAMVNADLTGLVDLLVFNNTVYMLKKNQLEIISLDSGTVHHIAIENAKRLSRTNMAINIIGNSYIAEVTADLSVKINFEDPAATFVDKNSNGYFAVGANKVYLYRP